jgi:hypothetical protein
MMDKKQIMNKKKQIMNKKKQASWVEEEGHLIKISSTNLISKS